MYLKKSKAVWGSCPDCYSRIPFVVIFATMTAQQYADDILFPIVLPFFLRRPELKFQHDNARPKDHTLCLKWKYGRVILAFSASKCKFLFFTCASIFNFIVPNGNAAFLNRISPRIRPTLNRKVATY